MARMIRHIASCRWGVRLLSLCAAVAALGAGSRTSGQEMSIPVDLQVRLIARIFSFDRAMEGRSRDGVTVGVLFQERYRMSAGTADEVEALMPGIGGFPNGPARVVRIPWGSPAEMSSALRAAGVDILYVTPLRSAEIPQVAEVCAGLRIPTFTGVPAYVGEGIALGVDRRAGKPVVLVNLPAARAAGTELSSQLLKLAEVIE